MRRIMTLAAVAGLAAASVAPAFAAPRRPMEPQVGAVQPGYYVIRWDNTGICQIWNEQLNYKPKEWPSTYKVVSRVTPTFHEAMTTQLKLREERRCTL